MTVYAGTGFVGFIDEAFTGTLTGVIGAPPTGGKVVITAWVLTGSGAAVSPAFVGHTSTSTVVKQILANPGTWTSASDTVIKFPTNDSVDIAGGAGSGVLNGYICYRFEGSAGGSAYTAANIGE